MITITISKIEDDDDDYVEYVVSDNGDDWDDGAYESESDAEDDAEERVRHYGGPSNAKIKRIA